MLLHKILFSPLENKIHIVAPLCHILCILTTVNYWLFTNHRLKTNPQRPDLLASLRQKQPQQQLKLQKLFLNLLSDKLKKKAQRKLLLLPKRIRESKKNLHPRKLQRRLKQMKDQMKCRHLWKRRNLVIVVSWPGMVHVHWAPNLSPR